MWLRLHLLKIGILLVRSNSEIFLKANDGLEEELYKILNITSNRKKLVNKYHIELLWIEEWFNVLNLFLGILDTRIWV